MKKKVQISLIGWVRLSLKYLYLLLNEVIFFFLFPPFSYFIGIHFFFLFFFLLFLCVPVVISLDRLVS